MIIIISLIYLACVLMVGLPVMISEGQKLLMTLPERYPEIISLEQVAEVIADLEALRAAEAALDEPRASIARATMPSMTGRPSVSCLLT